MTDPTPTCATCRYREPESNRCRAQSPAIMTLVGKAVWPKVENTDWCGDYKPAPKGKA